MKIKDSIQKNVIEMLLKMGYGVKKIDFSHQWNNGITYHIDLEHNKQEFHISISYDFKNKKCSIQIICDKFFKRKSQICYEEKDFHSFVINYLTSIF